MHGFMFFEPDTMRTYSIQHNGDFSGDVHIAHHGVEAIIPFTVMLEVVGRWLQQQKINDIESMTGTEMMEDVAP